MDVTEIWIQTTEKATAVWEPAVCGHEDGQFKPETNTVTLVLKQAFITVTVDLSVNIFECSQKIFKDDQNFLKIDWKKGRNKSENPGNLACLHERTADQIEWM